MLLGERALGVSLGEEIEVGFADDFVGVDSAQPLGVRAIDAHKMAAEIFKIDAVGQVLHEEAENRGVE